MKRLEVSAYQNPHDVLVGARIPALQQLTRSLCKSLVKRDC